MPMGDWRVMREMPYCDLSLAYCFGVSRWNTPPLPVFYRVLKHLPAIRIAPSLSTRGKLSDLVWVCERKRFGQ
jgi:hypothetical protein